MAVKVLDLFEAFTQDCLPKDKAYIVSSFINESSGYAIYEIISYSGVKSIYPDAAGLTFQSSGKKLFVLVEPATYPRKGEEPYLRAKQEAIPMRFNELDIITCKNQIKVMIGKIPTESLSSFTVAKPSGMNVSLVFYDIGDVYDSMTKFFEASFNKDMGVPQVDAKKAGTEVVSVVKEKMHFKGDFE